MKSWSLTARASLLFGLGVTVVLLGLGWLVAWSVDRHFQEMDRYELEGKLALVVNLLAKADSPEAMRHVPKALEDALVGHQGLWVTLTDARGNTLFSSHNSILNPAHDHALPPTALLRMPPEQGLATCGKASGVFAA